MGAAPCKNPKSSEENQKKEDSKKITIGVFGLDNAGKTSTVKAIEGAPTKDTDPTMSSETSKVPYPTGGKGDNKSQDRITIIDVSGSKKFRERSWSEYYDQIHGLIFVIDASEKKRIKENKDILEDLLDNRELQNKPILILANKQDRRGAISEEDDIKEKLQIEQLKRKHKIEFCTAIPSGINNNKADESIRQGFSWLIRTIETNYTEINARVNQEKNSRSSRPIDKKPPVKPRSKTQNSDDSDNDGIVYSKNRAGSPPLNRKTTDYRSSSPPLNRKTTDYRTGSPPLYRKTTDYRSPITSTKLPSLDLNKSKGKPSGNETYDESDDENDRNRSRSRPTIGRSDYDNHDRDSSLNQTNSTSTNGFNKKKKVIGAANLNNNNTLVKKPSSDEPKSFRSSYEPFPEEAPWSSSSRTTKTTKPDDITTRSFTKPLLTNDPVKRMSPLVHDTKPYSSSSLLKRDNLSDDDDDLYGKQKSKSTPLLVNKPTSTYKKPTLSSYGINEDDDYEKDYLKKGAPKTTKSYDSDDDNKSKTFQRSSDRFNLNSEYRGAASKPPSSPSLATTRSKHDDDDFPSSSLSKPFNRTKFTKDDYSSSSTKPTISSRFNNDDNDDRPSSLSKPPLYSRYGDNDNNRPLSSAKTTTYSKYNDDDYKSPIRSKFDDDDGPSSTIKPTRSKYDDDDRPSSTIKSTTRSKYDDDDDDNFGSSSKPAARSNYYDNKHSTSPLKPLSNSKFEDDDDFGSSSKPAARSNYYDNKRTASPAKPTSYSKYDDDDDIGSSSKTTTRPKYDDDDDYDSSLKPTTRSKYTNNDTKSNSRSKYDDDDDDYRSNSPVKPTSRSKYDDDDDDYPSSSKKNNYSSRDDDYSTKGGSSSARIASASTNRYRSNS